MHDMNIKEQEKEIESIVSEMNETEREHMRRIVYMLAQCYKSDSDSTGLFVFGGATGVTDVITLNCSRMTAAQMVVEANEAVAYLNTTDAPPKEMFN